MSAVVVSVVGGGGDNTAGSDIGAETDGIGTFGIVTLGDTGDVNCGGDRSVVDGDAVSVGNVEPGVDNGELRVGVEDRDIRDVNIVLTFCSASSADESDDADTGDARDDTGEGGCVTSAPRISTGSTSGCETRSTISSTGCECSMLTAIVVFDEEVWVFVISFMCIAVLCIFTPFED